LYEKATLNDLSRVKIVEKVVDGILNKYGRLKVATV